MSGRVLYLAEDPTTALMSVQIPMDFNSWNENATKSRQPSKHLPADQSSDRFFADTQFSRCGTDIQCLAFWGARRSIHDQIVHE
jgi:hypothetical protein